ncbi:MAG: ribbon-helix-helix domain-containing protein [Alphaproteobacteria bacterium]|jgi:predicted DNA-binding ribbon-helix-helix protein
MSSPVKRSVVVAGHQTSISLEEPFWEALVKIAKSEDVSLNSLITQIDRDRQGNLSSALRVFVLKSLQEGQN